MKTSHIGLTGVLRLGLVQACLGAVIVLTTSTINRIMVVELALPALVPGLLVGLHYAIQITRPRMGYGSDAGGRRTPWIIGGMLILAVGGFLAALSTAIVNTSPALGIVMAVFAFLLVGLGVGAAGTSLLVLLAKSVAPRYRGAAASTSWIMMIMGIILTSIVAGILLEPFSFERLLLVSAGVSVVAFSLACLSVVGIENRVSTVADTNDVAAQDALNKKIECETQIAEAGFLASLKVVWSEPASRRFSVFVFVSMLAYSAQDLILEPFAGAVLGATPGESTQLTGVHHSGVLAGMLLVALFTSMAGARFLAPLRHFSKGEQLAKRLSKVGSNLRRLSFVDRLLSAMAVQFASLRLWITVGCVASALALLALAAGGLFSDNFPLKLAVLALGLGNGVFAVAAIGSMMDLVGRGARQREGVRMGLWGAAQAIAFGLGGISATFLVDVSRVLLNDLSAAYAIVFVFQALLFFWAAKLAAGVYQPASPETTGQFSPGRIALELNQ